MSYIAHIDNFYDLKGRVFGYIGRDLTTGQTRYFYIDKNKEPNIEEFNIHDIKDSQILNLMNKSGNFYEKDYWNLNTPNKQIVAKFAQKHLDYNKQYGYPQDIFKANLTTLRANFLTNHHLPLSINGSYAPLNNELLLNVDIKNTQSLNNSYYQLLYLMGLIKVSRCYYQNNELIVKSGFASDKYQVIPILLPDGDVFLKRHGLPSKPNILSTTLDRLINDGECTLICPNYPSFYNPNFAINLKELCGGAINMARYTDGMSVYYKEMAKIIPDQNLANLLLMEIKTSKNDYRHEEEASYILARYKKAKK